MNKMLLNALLLLLLCGCSAVQGVRVQPYREACQEKYRWLYTTGFVLNPINDLLWILNRLPCIPFNTLPVDDSYAVKGFRYYLPQPVAVLNIGADGKLTMEILYVPDESEEYAVVSCSSLGSNAMGLYYDSENNSAKSSDSKDTHPNGLLSKIDFSVDNTAVSEEAIKGIDDIGKQAVSTAGTLTESILNQRVKLEEKVESANATVEAKRKVQIDAINARNYYEISLGGAPGKVDYKASQLVEWTKLNDAVTSAGNELVAAERALEMAQERLENYRNDFGMFHRPAPGVSPARPATNDEITTTSLAPTLFAITTNNHSVSVTPMIRPD